MRQRKVKNLETKYEAYEDILIYDPPEMRGKWAQRAGGRPVYAEIGCGKGKFISELAAHEPEHFFVAVEGNRSVMLRALEKIRALGLDNVAFAPEFADDLTEWFAPGEVRGIYLNFSDPLPKNYWYRRRLTYRDRLKSYFAVMDDEGTVTFKTDNTGFFEWSLQEIMAADLRVQDITRDLHAETQSIEDPDVRMRFNIETEYEAKFSGLGEKIKRVVIARGERKDEAGMNTSLAAYNGRNIPDDMAARSGIRLDACSREKATLVKRLFGSYAPKSFTEAVCAPGRTEAARLAVSDYSCPCDKILVSEKHDPVYDAIAGDMIRSVECFSLNAEDGSFCAADAEYRIRKLLRTQEHLLIVIDAGAYGNIPAEIMAEICRALNDTDLNKKIAVLADVTKPDALPADYAGRTSALLEPLDSLRSNVLPMVTDGKHLMCLAYSPETAEEFVRVCSFTAAASWTAR